MWNTATGWAACYNTGWDTRLDHPKLWIVERICCLMTLTMTRPVRRQYWVAEGEGWQWFLSVLMSVRHSRRWGNPILVSLGLYCPLAQCVPGSGFEILDCVSLYTLLVCVVWNNRERHKLSQIISTRCLIYLSCCTFTFMRQNLLLLYILGVNKYVY